MKVASYAEQISLVCAALVKEAAVEQKLCEKVWGEDVLIAIGYKTTLKTKIVAPLARATQVAHKACSLAVSDAGATSSDTILQVVR